MLQRLLCEESAQKAHESQDGAGCGTAGTDHTNETRAAEKTRIHAATPTVAHADTLGRTFLTIAHNKLKYSDTPAAAPPVEEFHQTRIVLDIEGNQREVIDAKDRVVMRYDYDMLGNRVHQASMEAGERWMLNGATILGVAPRSMRRWLQDGQLVGRKIGGRVPETCGQ